MSDSPPYSPSRFLLEPTLPGPPRPLHRTSMGCHSPRTNTCSMFTSGSILKEGNENQDVFCPFRGRKGNWALENQLLLPVTPDSVLSRKKHVQVVYKGVCLLSSRGAHLANEVRSVQICLLWERRGDLSSSVSCC